MVTIILFICLALAVLLLLWKMQRQKRDIYVFSKQLEQCLDAMISEKSIDGFSGLEDSLWDKTYEKLRKLQRIWERQNQKNVKEKKQIKELISDISHQTKTPVANMKIYLEILENGVEDPEERTDFLFKMRGQIEKLDFLIQSMVKMSRLETGTIEIHQQTGKIYDMLGCAVAAIVPMAEKKGISLYVDCEEELLAKYDRKWTEEAVFNILDNAVKYTAEGGSITIEVSIQEFFTKISIRDNGKGIRRERQAQIFQRFYREPEVHEENGIGVGLYLARKIITMQNGYIEVCSELGEGSEFRIYLLNE